MPRVSRKQTELNREAIKAEASRLYRERGLQGVGIPDITRAAGLTHGSFYGHFSSKDGLAAEAVTAAFAVGFERWDARRKDKPSAAAEREGLIRGYLTPRNRDNPGDACPIAALAGDIARLPAESEVRQAFQAGLGVILEKLAAVHRGEPSTHVEQKALTDIAAMVGALMLSRALSGSDLSDRFLSLVADELIASAPPSPGEPDA